MKKKVCKKGEHVGSVKITLANLEKLITGEMRLRRPCDTCGALVVFGGPMSAGRVKVWVK